MVSIIVRTKDRPEQLKYALASIAAQTYRPIEVVLVNDGGCDIDVCDARGVLKDVSLNYIRLEKNMGRAHAGNVGIEHAQGLYIGFLDDDDELYDDHVATLVSFLKQSKSKVVYSAVDFVERQIENGTSIIQRVFGKEFARDDLLIENYIPLISLLFEASVLKQLYFDREFELFEDWDLLIRVAENNHFSFINRITCRYNQWDDSQIAFKSPASVVKEAALKIYEKHLSKFSPSLVYRLCVEEWNSRPEVKKLYKTIELQEKEINSLKQQAMHKDIMVRSTVKSRGLYYVDKLRKLMKWH